MNNTQSVKYHLTYIWLDAKDNLRQKVKISPIDNLKLDSSNIPYPENFPIWNFDGSSTGQADTQDSEVLIRPVSVYNTTKISKNSYVSYVILCECLLPDMNPHPTNHRQYAKSIFEKVIKYESSTNQKSDRETLENIFKPWYGIEQEFFIMNPRTGNPLNYDISREQGPDYCSISSNLNPIVNEMLLSCLNVGLNTVGYNLEVAPGQAEIQLLSEGLKACDDMIMMRYIIMQVAESHGYYISFHPKPLTGNWNGSGAHVNYSTQFMRTDEKLTYHKNPDMTQYDHIMHSITQFEQNHEKHISVYGEDNDKRLTGKHETSSMETFSYGIADRSASIRIPRQTHTNKYGYIEDRRPSSNFNPYIVLPLIFETSINELV